MSEDVISPTASSEMMRAAWYERTGPAREVLQTGTVPKPVPNANEVRVAVRVSGLNPSDTKRRGGWAGSAMPYPRVIPHNDGAGLIDAVGPGVTGYQLRDRVWIFEAQIGRPFSTAAEFVVVPVQNIVRLPSVATFEQGAALGVPAMTAHRALTAAGSVKDKTVLITGGARVVGNTAIQMAKWLGASMVIATVSSHEQGALATSAGADLVIDRKVSDVATLVKNATDGLGVDLVVDVAIHENWRTDLNVVKTNGEIAAYAIAEPDTVLHSELLTPLLKAVTVRFVFVYEMPAQAHTIAAKDINAALTAGALRPRIGKAFSLDEIALAHELQDSGLSTGKLLLKITP